MAFVKLELKQRWGLLIVAIWTAVVVVLAITRSNVGILGLLGMNAVFAFPFRKRKPPVIATP